MTKAKDAFAELLNLITLTDRDEATAILYHFFESKLQLSREQIMSNHEIEFEKINFLDSIARINQHEPIQYITERAWFKNTIFEVNPAVLIPRPETEMIVDFVIGENITKHTTVLDVGTGSGCIAICIKINKPMANVFALDVSQQAIELARKNSARLKASVEFICSDFLSSSLAIAPMDYLVSNPPYVMENERLTMEKNVLGYEPSLALFVPDHDPLLFYRALSTTGKKLLKPHGTIVAEINPKVATETIQLFELQGYTVACFDDFERKPRMIAARKRQ